MGSGTGIALEASDIVLLDDSFESIIKCGHSGTFSLRKHSTIHSVSVNY